MKKLLVLLITLFIFSVTVKSQTDTNFSSKTGLPLENGKKAYITNSHDLIYKNSTILANEAAIRMMYVTNPQLNVVKKGIDSTYTINTESGVGVSFRTFHILSGNVDTLSRRLDVLDTCNSLRSLGFTRNFQIKISCRVPILYSTDATFVSNKTALLWANDGNVDESLKIQTGSENIYVKPLYGGVVDTVRYWVWEN